ncbi:MAG: hypothetical protein HZB26_25810, partial [Candidatus Hydrogenedentes bacterium]|nr:hypothetical protein [Candidatus Hydrogenedentota bacterium]
QLEMKRYDNTERVVTIDWSLSISEHTPGRANALEFEGKMALTRLEIWLGGQIDLDALDVPADLEVRSGDEIEAFIKRHTEKRKRPDTNK